jgi:hypothetical protein
MRKIFLIIIALTFCYQSNAQEIKVLSTFSVSGYDYFQQNVGFGIGYDHIIQSKNKLGFTFYQSFNRSDYSYVFESESDGKNYFREVSPNNQRITFSVNYSFWLAGTRKSKFYISPVLGLNSFRLNETGTEKVVNETTEAYPYKSDCWESYKPGIGLSFEYERQIISDKILLSISAHPELIFFSWFGLKGSTTSPILGFINFHLTLKYNMVKDKNKK